MKIKFIGTASGKTEIDKFHSSILIKNSNCNLLVDAGDGIAKAIISAGESHNNIDKIIISHFHADHFSGIPSLLTQMKLTKRKNPLTILAHKSRAEFLLEFIESSYIFPEILDFELKIIGFEFNNSFLIAEDFYFTPKQNSHLRTKAGILNKFSVPFISSSFLINNGSKNIFYTSDIGSTEDLFLFKGKQIDILISEAAHISVPEILEAVKELKPEKVFLTHFSSDDKLQLENEIEKCGIEKKIFLAEEGLEIIL